MSSSPSNFGHGYGCKLDSCSNKPNIHYDGTIENRQCDKYSAYDSANGGLLFSIYGDCEGSLVWLNKRERFRWPYCLFVGDGEESEEKLSYEDTRQELRTLLELGKTPYELCHTFDVSRACISQWKNGKTRGPVELRTYRIKLQGKKDEAL